MQIFSYNKEKRGYTPEQIRKANAQSGFTDSLCKDGTLIARSSAQQCGASYGHLWAQMNRLGFGQIGEAPLGAEEVHSHRVRIVLSRLHACSAPSPPSRRPSRRCALCSFHV